MHTYIHIHKKKLGQKKLTPLVPFITFCHTSQDLLSTMMLQTTMPLPWQPVV